MVTAPERKTKIKNRTKNKKTFAKVWKKLPWGKAVIVFIIAAICYLFYIFWPKTINQLSYLEALPQEQQVSVGQMIGHAYRNIHGYKIVCAQSDFNLKNYPEEFKKSMDGELESLEQVLMRDNVSLEQAFTIFIQGDVAEKIHQELYNELKVIAAPDDNGVASSCQLLDADAADIAQNVTDEIRPLYLEILASLFEK